MPKYTQPVFCRHNTDVQFFNVQPAVSSLVESMALAGFVNLSDMPHFNCFDIKVPGAKSGSGKPELYCVQSWQVAPEAWVFRVIRNVKVGRQWSNVHMGALSSADEDEPMVIALGLAMDCLGAENTARSFVRVRCKMEKSAQ